MTDLPSGGLVCPELQLGVIAVPGQAQEQSLFEPPSPAVTAGWGVTTSPVWALPGRGGPTAWGVGWGGSPGHVPREGPGLDRDRGPSSADDGKRVVYILPSKVKDHYILYCEGELDGQEVRMAKLVGEHPASPPPQTPASSPCFLLSGEAPGGSPHPHPPPPRLSLSTEHRKCCEHGDPHVTVSRAAHMLTGQLAASPTALFLLGVSLGEPALGGNPSSWGLIPGRSLKEASERQDCP